MFVDDSNFIFCENFGKFDELRSAIQDDMTVVAQYFNENSLVINSNRSKVMTLRVPEERYLN